MKSFDPFGWTARYTGSSFLSRAIRYGGAALFAAFLIRRITQYGDFTLKPLWAAETLVYAALFCAFLMRIEPIDRSTGWRDVAVPLVGAVLPFALLTTPPHASVAEHPLLMQSIFWCMTAATGLTVWGMWTLRRAFSITVEARELVARGPYRWIRHPIYLGEMLTAAAVATWRFSWHNAVLFGAFVAIQLIRARREEQKLSKWFPQYGGGRAWWLWPLQKKTNQPT